MAYRVAAEPTGGKPDVRARQGTGGFWDEIIKAKEKLEFDTKGLKAYPPTFTPNAITCRPASLAFR